jgi:hypothetical protein
VYGAGFVLFLIWTIHYNTNIKLHGFTYFIIFVSFNLENQTSTNLCKRVAKEGIFCYFFCDDMNAL